MQIPFESQGALKFCRDVKKNFHIKDENVYNVGDEVDEYYGSLFDKDPNATLTADQEINRAREIMRQWYDVFPKMKLCESNHGQRWIKKATKAQIPSQMLRRYQDVLETPKGWQWKKQWCVKDRFPFIVEHGDDHGGQYPHVSAALANGVSTVIGHHHSRFGVEFFKTNGLDIWGAVAGCLIDFEQFAFEYARKAKFKPINGVIVVVDDGRTPILVPLR